MGPTIEIIKMEDFAKLFKHDEYGQILVVADTGQNDKGEETPKVSISFKPFGKGVCTISLFFGGLEDGYDGRDECFKNMDMGAAVEVVKSLIEGLS